ncbi:MAG: HAMP domain-containing protein [Bdellovibrio sp.]|nr:HAMP domain-containing protein [Bdellovibrio sp.]
MRSASIQKKLILLGTAVVAVPIIISTYIVINRIAHEKLVRAAIETENLSQAVSVSVDQWNAKLSKVIQALAENSDTKDIHKPQLTSFLVKINKIYNEFYLVFITDKNGIMVARSDNNELTDNSDRNYIQRALRGTPSTAEAVISKTKKEPAICFSSPLRDKEDKVMGVVVGCALVSDFAGSLTYLNQGRTGRILVSDERNRLIARTDNKRLETLDSQGHVFLKKEVAVFAHLNSEYLDQQDRKWIFSSNTLKNGWRILVERQELEVLEPVQYVKYISYIFSALIIFIVGSLLSVTIVKILAPLSDFTKSMAALQRGNYSHRVPAYETAEFKIMGDAFNQMAEQIEFLFEQNRDYQSRLIETNMRLENEAVDRTQQLAAASKMSALGEMMGGVAHEINTPLATIKLITGQALSDIQSGIPDIDAIVLNLQRIDGTTDRVAKIIKGLKTFSRSGEHDPMELASLQSIIEDTLVLSEDKLRKHNVDFQWEIPAETIELVCRPVEVSQILLNLITNSIDAIENHETKWVKLTVQDLGDSITIQVIDSGEGIPEELRYKIFEPFVTTKAIGKGTGIGLSISHGIARGHKGDLYVDSSQVNTCFVLTLPKNISEKVNLVG